MAFPQVTSITPYSFPSASTAHSMSIGSFTAGDLMVLIFTYEGINAHTPPSGWKPLEEQNNTTVTHVAYAKKYEVTDTTVNIATSDSVTGCGQIYRIAAGSWWGNVDRVFGGGDATGISTTPSPNVLNVDTGALDYLWIASYGADDDDDASSAPSNYTNLTYTEASSSGTTCSMATARRENNTDSENPSTFTIAASEEWVAITLGIAPARSIEITHLDRSAVQYGSPLVISGVSFGAANTGSAKIEIANNAVYGSATIVDIIDAISIINSWSDGVIDIGAIWLDDIEGGDAWLYVTNSLNVRSAGYPITVKPSGGVTGTPTLVHGQTGVVFAGHGFGATKGSSKAWLSNNPNFGKSILTEQTTTAWSNTSVTITINTSGIIRGKAYLFIQKNPVTDPDEVYILEALFTPPSVFEDGARQMAAEIFDHGMLVAGNIGNGQVKLLECETEEVISGIGNWSASISRTDPNSSLVAVGKEVAIMREGEADVFYGIIDNIKKTTGRNGEKLLTMYGYELSAELLRNSTYRGIFLKDVAIADAVDEILVDTTWTPLITGTDYSNTYTRFDDKTKVSSLFDLAALKTAYVRSTDTPREIEIKNYHTDTHMRLLPVEMMDARARQNPVLGFYESHEKTEDGSEIWNRIVPEAKSDSERYYDLNGATNDTPYDIRSKFVTSPNLVNQMQDGENSGIIDSFIEVIGENRFLVVFLTYHFDGASPTAVAVIAGGALMTLRAKVDVAAFDGGSGGTFEVWTLTNPPKGSLSLNVVKDDLYTGVFHFTVCQAVVFNDVDQVDPIRDIVIHDGTEADFSTSVESIEGDLVIDGFTVTFGNSTNGTPGAGQEEVGIENATRPRGSIKPATETTTEMSWTGNTAAAWAHAVLSLKPALAWYIQDDVSVATYGLRAKVAPFGERIPAEVLDLVSWLNTIYDEAADYLMKHRDISVSYSLSKVIIPQPASYWRVGDIISIFDEDEAQEVVMICTRRRATYDENGIRFWDIDLSTTTEVKKSYDEAFKEAFERLNILQFRQV